MTAAYAKPPRLTHPVHNGITDRDIPAWDVRSSSKLEYLIERRAARPIEGVASSGAFLVRPVQVTGTFNGDA